MLALTLNSSSGKSQKKNFDSGSWIVGRGMTSDLRIKSPSVARQHAVLDVYEDRQMLRSMGAGNSFLVNGQNVENYGPIKTGDVIEIGGWMINVDVASICEDQPVQSRPVSTAVQAQPVPVTTHTESAISPATEPTELDTVEGLRSSERYAELTSLRQTIQEQVQEQLDLHRRNLISDMSSDELRIEATRMADRVLAKDAISIPADVNKAQLIEEVVAEAIGLGPIEPLLEDESITEIMVNGPDSVYVERSGRLHPAGVQFINDRSLMSVIERIVTPLGRRIDEGSPMVDARLTDGSRVNAIIPPLSLKGPAITIRKFSKKRFDMQNLVTLGSISPGMAEFLLFCVEQRQNIIISGGTGSGKTTFLNALSDAIPNSERIVTIEDAAELRLAQQHVVSLEARPSNVEGKGQVSIRDLVRNALRMRPDRIVVGECRGGEALDMLQAMNTGHDGSLTTGHANSPRDLLSRLEVMVLMSGMDLPVRAIREQISSAVDIVVQQNRFRDGRRRVTSIVEIDRMEGDVILMQTLFEFRQSGVSADGMVLGEYVGLGNAPKFYSELESAGMKPERQLFKSRWSPESDELEPLTPSKNTSARVSYD